MTAQRREQGSRIKGQRRADALRNGGARGNTEEDHQQQQEQLWRGRIAISGDERQGQCGSQQAHRGEEEAAEVCDASRLGPTGFPLPHPCENIMNVSIFDQWWRL